MRNGFEKMLTENLLLKGLFVMIACVEKLIQLKKNLRSTNDVTITIFHVEDGTIILQENLLLTFTV